MSFSRKDIWFSLFISFLFLFSLSFYIYMNYQILTQVQREAKIQDATCFWANDEHTRITCIPTEERDKWVNLLKK